MPEINRYQAVASLLNDTKEDINTLLTGADDELHRIRIATQLDRMADQLLLLTGSGDARTAETKKLGPAKTIGGVPIGKIRRFTEDDLHASDDKLYNLRKQVEAAYAAITEVDPATAIATWDDIVLRGVAKRAGLKVTKDEPAVLTEDFIQKVVSAIIENQSAPNGGNSREGEHHMPGTEPIQTPAAPKVGEGDVSDVINTDANNFESVLTDQQAELKALEEKHTKIADLIALLNQAKSDVERLKTELASEANKNKRTAIRKELAEAEIKLASLSKQLEELQ